MLIYKLPIQVLDKLVEQVLIATKQVTTVAGLSCYNKITPEQARNAILGGLQASTGDYYYSDDWMPISLSEE